MAFDRMAYRDPRPLPWLIGLTGLLNRHLILPRLLRIERIDLPVEDETRLRAAVHPGSAAFIGPNHPEFTTDWMLDKEIAHRVSPRMAHWASWDIVNAHPLAQRFWLGLNLIANVPGGGGRARSLQVAREGHGVLLHPEGTATWRGARVGALVPGIATLALDAWRAERAAPTGPAGTPRPVWVVPVVWRLRFTGDVSRALGREVDRIARALDLDVPRACPLEARFAALHVAVLIARARRFGVVLPCGGPADFFAAQETLAGVLIRELASRHGAPKGPPGRWLHGVRRACRRASRDDVAAARDLALAREIERLHRFEAEDTATPGLTQERIAESLQQIRSSLVTRGWRNALHNLVPVAVGRRIAHVRVPAPIAVDGRAAAGALVDQLQARMQAGLDALGESIASDAARFVRPNPFIARGVCGKPHRARRFRPGLEVVGPASSLPTPS